MDSKPVSAEIDDSSNDPNSDSERHPVERLATEYALSLRQRQDATTDPMDDTPPTSAADRALAAYRLSVPSSAGRNRRPQDSRNTDAPQNSDALKNAEAFPDTGDLPPSGPDGGKREGDDDHDRIADLASLAPVIEQLERARHSRAQQAASWASLGRDRPERLGDFILQRPIGRGGMGVVFEARQESLGRIVALKILPRDLFSDQTGRSRFLREAQTVASLHHTNIVPIYGVGFDEGCHYFVMQRLEGVGVDQVLSRDGNIDPAVVAELGHQAASALGHAHEHQVFHRDIKPSNLIVSDDHQLWVTDFGVSKTVASESVTKTGDAVGTLRYMAPEQAIGNSDHRSDVYSLGVSMYEMLTGLPALGDDDLVRALAGEAMRSPKPLAKALPGISRDLATIVETAMQRDPAARYQSAETMADDLNAFLEGRPVSVRPLGLVGGFRRWANHRPAVAGLSAALVIALLCLGGTMAINSVRLSRSLDQQRIARGSAEQTASLATDALRNLFQHFSSSDSSAGQDPSAVGVSIDPGSARVLEELVPYYDAIARQVETRDTKNSNSLNQAAYEALLTVAEMQLQLGQYDSAIDTIARADAQLAQLAWPQSTKTIERARLRNRSGVALKLSGQDEQSVASHLQAIEILTPLIEGSSTAIAASEFDRASLEIARSHYLLGFILLPGMGPDRFPPPEALSTETSASGVPLTFDRDDSSNPSGESTSVELVSVNVGPTPDSENRETSVASTVDRRFHLNRCVELTSDLLDQRDTASKIIAKAADHLLAMALRERGRKWSTDDASDDLAIAQQTDRQESVTRLRRLVKDSPHNETLSFELASTLSDINVFKTVPDRTHDQFQQDMERLRDAKGLYDELVRRHPHVTKYSLGAIHTNFKLARTLESAPHSRMSVHPAPPNRDPGPWPPNPRWQRDERPPHDERMGTGGPKNGRGPRRGRRNPEDRWPPPHFDPRPPNHPHTDHGAWSGPGPRDRRLPPPPVGVADPDSPAPGPLQSPRREVLDLYREASKGIGRLVQTNPDSNAYRYWNALFLEHIGKCQAELGWHRAAKSTFERVAKLNESLADCGHYDPAILQDWTVRLQTHLDALPPERL